MFKDCYFKKYIKVYLITIVLFLILEENRKTYWSTEKKTEVLIHHLIMILVTHGS